MKPRATPSLLCITVVLLLALFWSIGCGSSQTAPQAGSTRPDQRYFRLNLGTEPPTLDPVECSDLVSMTVLVNIMRGLTQYQSHQGIEPAYAQRWDKSADGLHYRFYLRKNGRWSDGKPVTAHDFVYAWRRVLDPKNGSPYAFLLFDIKNARDFYHNKIKDPALLGFKALDDYTLDVTLDRPVAYFLQIMAFSISLPQRRDIVERYPDSFTEAGHYVTNGPYLLDTWDHENQIVLKPNPRYWAGPPKNQGIRMFMIPEPNTSLIMYENNELDFVETVSSLPVKEVRRLKGRPDFHQNTLHAISYFGFNTRKKPFDNPLVRKAFIAAFDRTYIPKLFQGGETPITSWITPGLFAYNPEIGIAFNVDQARHYLAQAGFPEGRGFPKVELLYASTTPENRQMAEIAQYQWRKNLGVEVEIKNVEWKVFLKQLQQDPPHIFRLQWYVDYPDPDSFLGVFISDSGNGHIQWSSPRYDQWVKAAAIEQDPARRKALYNQAQKLLLEEVAGIMPLYVIPKSYLVKPHIKGFHLNELNLAILDDVQVLPGQPAP